jgi:23S rRNA (uracil1939-C5)-methyltransferase
MKSTDKKNVSPLKKGDKIEITVSALDDDGCGIAVHDSTQIRVSGGLPGDRLLARVTYSSQHRITAERIRVVEPSAQRIPSPCRHIPACDACPLIEMDYSSQLTWKESHVSNNIHQHQALQSLKILPVKSSPKKLQYRNSAKLVIAGKFAEPLIGLYKRESHDILDIANCALHNPLINRIVAAVKKGITKGKVPIYHPKSEQGLLRYLLIRVAEPENKAMVVLVTSKRSYNELHHLAAFICKEVPEVKVIAQNVNPSTGNTILGSNDYFHTKQTTLETTINGVRFLVSPRSFFQINTGSAGIIYNLVKEFSDASKNSNVLDLYCGVGAISIILAPLAGNILGIEVVESAVEDARRNARLNRASNCEFEAGDVVEELEAIVKTRAEVELIILNPPRKGCEESVLNQVAKIGANKIIYVSCSPASLGRDLSKMHSLGYDCRTIQPVDMFPQTTHVESVAVLERR